MTAEPTQLLTGLSVGLPPNRVVCVGCGDQLAEERALTVYGYPQAARAVWDFRRSVTRNRTVPVR